MPEDYEDVIEPQDEEEEHRSGGGTAAIKVNARSHRKILQLRRVLSARRSTSRKRGKKGTVR